MNPHSQAPPPGPLQKLLAVVAGAVVLVIGFMFSLVFLALLAVVGLSAWAYVWWKTRALRRTLRDNPPGGTVIEGEVVVVEDHPAVRQERILPRDTGA